MQTVPVLLLAIAGAYLLGSIPFAVVSSRLFGLADPRTYGSKNPGATNVLRSGNKFAAVLTLIGDAAKGFIAVWLAITWRFEEAAIALIALAVFGGHLYPIFLRFKGGKGVATAAGVLMALHPLLGGATLGIWIAVAITTRYSSLAALLAAVGAPLLAAMIWGMGPITVAIGAIAMALVIRHWENLQRLMTGTETQIGASKKTAESSVTQPPAHGKTRGGRGKH